MDKLHSEFGFTTPIPDVVIEALPEIGSEGLAMFSYLMFRIYSDKRTRGEFAAWPSWKNMEIQTGMTRHKIGKGLKALEDHGFLTRKKRYSDSVIYTLKNPDPQFPNNWGTDEIEGVDSSLIVREMDPVPQQLGTNQEQVKKEDIEKEQPRTTTTDVAVADPSYKNLIDEMKSLGVHWKRAEKLCAEFDHAELKAHLRITREKTAAGKLDNPAGYFYTAVTQGFEILELVDQHSYGMQTEDDLKEWLDAG